MKSYPSIQFKINSEIDVLAFDKLDGSCIRVEWTPKNGFSKVGTRRRLLDETDTHLGKAIPTFYETWPEKLEKVFKDQRWNGKQMKIVCFFEFHGENSFAGQHRKDDNHILTLFDVAIHKKGIVPPKDFYKFFGHLNIPKLLYRGKVNKTFIDSVKDSSLEDMTFEGVVCKGHRKGKKAVIPLMFKIKSQAWLTKLKEYCGEDANKFKMLR
jgi:hypothetical protein